MPDTPSPDLQERVAPAAALPHAKRRALEQAATDCYERLAGPLELHAAVLALLLPAGSQRAVRAWQAECSATPDAEPLRAHAVHLGGAARLPWLERLLSRLRPQPLATRQALLAATRRVMGARGTVRPIDRLHWLAMRQRLGEASGAGTQAPATADLSRLPESDVLAIARYSAFLARMVPVETPEPMAKSSPEPMAKSPPESATEATLAPTAPSPLAPTPGVAWYERVMAPWQAHASIPPCVAPDTDGLVHALQELQALAWMQRPTLVRGWLTAARQHSPSGRLTDSAADALRLSCALLDSPLPPELSRHYGEPLTEAPR